MEKRRNEEVRQAVRKTYGEIARGEITGCGCGPSSCCGSVDHPKSGDVSVGLGYNRDDISTFPEGANLGLGCGNPHGIASLNPGETVLDLGSGGGIDCFLAERAVGQEGFVIGVDMTPEMVYRSRENAEKAGLGNVAFRLGEIENLPVADNSVDVISSVPTLNGLPVLTYREILVFLLKCNFSI
jgi:SAM-dependent methyltransferase